MSFGIKNDNFSRSVHCAGRFFYFKPMLSAQHIVGATSGRPSLLPDPPMRYPHNIYVFTNHVGDGAPDVPLIDVSFTILFALYAQRSAHCFNHFTAQYPPHGTTTYPCETSPQYYRTPTDIPTNGGRGEQCSPAFVRPHGLYKFKL